MKQKLKVRYYPCSGQDRDRADCSDAKADVCFNHIIPSEKTRFYHPKAYIHVNVSTYASTCTFELHHEKTCVCEKKGANQLFTCTLYILFNIFLVVFTCKITSNQKIIISWVAASWVSIYFFQTKYTHIGNI